MREIAFRKIRDLHKCGLNAGSEGADVEDTMLMVLKEKRFFLALHERSSRYWAIMGGGRSSQTTGGRPTLCFAHVVHLNRESLLRQLEWIKREKKATDQKHCCNNTIPTLYSSVFRGGLSTCTLAAKKDFQLGWAMFW